MFYQYLLLLWRINVLVDLDALFFYKFENWIYKIENKEFDFSNKIVWTWDFEIWNLKY
jgi:hypothetical protein